MVLANKGRGVDTVINQVCIDTCRGNQMPKRKQGTVSLVWRGQSGRVRGVDVVRALAHWEYSMGVEPRYGKKGGPETQTATRVSRGCWFRWWLALFGGAARCVMRRAVSLNG